MLAVRRRNDTMDDEQGFPLCQPLNDRPSESGGKWALFVRSGSDDAGVSPDCKSGCGNAWQVRSLPLPLKAPRASVAPGLCHTHILPTGAMPGRATPAMEDTTHECRY